MFTYNASLAPVNNVHTANRVIECNPQLYDWQAPWRIELPQGGVIRGTADSVGTWPTAVDDQPANLRVRTLSESGPGRIMVDNAPVINQMLDAYNASVPYPAALGGVPSGSSPNMSPGSRDPLMMSERPFAGSGGCALGSPATRRPAPSTLGWVFAALATALCARSKRAAR